MTNSDGNLKRQNILFLSSSFVNLAKMFAENNPQFDVFLVLDRKFPFEIEDIDNFYTFTFDKNKVFEKDEEKYFDILGVFIDDFKPDFIILNNFNKELPKNFLDFMFFRKSDIKLLDIHHGDLRILDNKGNKIFDGFNGDIRQMLDEAMIISTLYLTNKNQKKSNFVYSHETTIKELKQKGLFKKKEDILNLRLRNVAISYHERTKVLKLLKKIIEGL